MKGQVAQLTLAQMGRLRSAMGVDTYRQWIAIYSRGEAKETVEELMNVIDDIGEELDNFAYCSASTRRPIQSTTTRQQIGWAI